VVGYAHEQRHAAEYLVMSGNQFIAPRRSRHCPDHHVGSWRPGSGERIRSRPGRLVASRTGDGGQDAECAGSWRSRPTPPDCPWDGTRKLLVRRSRHGQFLGKFLELAERRKLSGMSSSGLRSASWKHHVEYDHARAHARQSLHEARQDFASPRPATDFMSASARRYRQCAPGNEVSGARGKVCWSVSKPSKRMRARKPGSVCRSAMPQVITAAMISQYESRTLTPPPGGRLAGLLPSTQEWLCCRPANMLQTRRK